MSNTLINTECLNQAYASQRDFRNQLAVMGGRALVFRQSSEKLKACSCAFRVHRIVLVLFILLSIRKLRRMSQKNTNTVILRWSSSEMYVEMYVARPRKITDYLPSTSAHI